VRTPSHAPFKLRIERSTTHNGGRRSTVGARNVVLRALGSEDTLELDLDDLRPEKGTCRCWPPMG
jgi:hypothetical protein